MDLFIQLIKYVRTKQVLIFLCEIKCKQFNNIPFFTENYMVSDTFSKLISKNFKQHIINTYFIIDEPLKNHFKNYYIYLKNNHFNSADYKNVISKFDELPNSIVSYNYYNAKEGNFLHIREFLGYTDNYKDLLEKAIALSNVGV